MANPVVTVCAKGAWTKVLNAGTTAVIHQMSARPNRYFQTYRVAADPAPTDLTDAVPVFEDVPQLIVESASAIDVYIWAAGEAGAVRVDA